MSELEPTRTYSNHTATEVLRRMLDERGVEWEDCGNGATYVEHNGEAWRFDYDEPFDQLGIVCLSGYTPEQAIAATLGPKITGNTSDGYHTFNELYHHRAVLFSVIVRDHRELAWKSMRHHDGTMYDGMFIVGIETPEGQATYHYDIDPYWDMFNCKELDQAPEWDGHTPSEAIERIATLGATDAKPTQVESSGTCKVDVLNTGDCAGYECSEYIMHCNGCGHEFGHVLYNEDGDVWMSEPPNYCPNCGQRCVG